MTEQEANNTISFIESTMNDNIIISEYKTLICPECFNISEIKIISSLISTIEKPNISIERPKLRTFYSLNHSISGLCVHCKKYISKFTVVDSEIADIISDMNKLGFIVKSSFVGYVRDNEIIYPYIVLHKAYDVDDLNLPNGWKIDEKFPLTRIIPSIEGNIIFKELWDELRDWIKTKKEKETKTNEKKGK